jgi:hypothetical protein
LGDILVYAYKYKYQQIIPQLTKAFFL